MIACRPCTHPRVRHAVHFTVAAALAFGAATFASAQAWVPNEVLVSAQKDLLDPEFNQARGQIVWGDEQGGLWVCDIDRATGALTVANGKGVLVDPDAMRTNDVLKTGNGPEWVFRSGGDAILYTKFEGAHNTEQARIGYAVPAAGGGWTSGFLGPPLARRAPYGSETIDDPAPRATYVDVAGNHFWRDIDRPETEQLIPGVKQNVAPVRHVRGARALIYANKPASGRGGKQVFYQDLDTGVTEQLTTDSKDKDVPLMWKSPEFNGEFIFLAIVDRREMRIYRKLPPAGGGAPVWTTISSSYAPTGYSLLSPEPFSFNGKSYVALALVAPNDDTATEIWVANIDVANPIMRRVSDNAIVRARTDPEPFVTDQGPFIYYNRRQTTVKNNGGLALCGGVKCSDGLYRADTGIRQ